MDLQAHRKRKGAKEYLVLKEKINLDVWGRLKVALLYLVLRVFPRGMSGVSRMWATSYVTLTQVKESLLCISNQYIHHQASLWPPMSFK